MNTPRQSNATTLWYMIVIGLLMVACGQRQATTPMAVRKSLDSLISSSHNIDTLRMLQKRMEKEGNVLGRIIVCREIGRKMRNESLFDEALRYHGEELTLAEDQEDTLEMVQALTDCDCDDSQYTVLVVEDNRDIAAYIGKLLADRYSVAYATNGGDGLQKAIDLVPDLIVTDVMMPDMDGLELCRRVRANEVVNHIPIVIVTAKITEQERIEGIKAGADAYISKPFNVDELRTVVEKLLDRHRSLRSKFGDGMTSSNNDEEGRLTDAERRFVAKAVDHIYLLLDKQALDINALADKLCMSSRQFHRKIVAITGCSPASFVMKIKMKRARHLLENDTRMGIDEIASRCGFEHTSSFYHAFRKTYGVTPKDIRRGVEDN